MGNHNVQPLKWSVDDLNRLADSEGTIESHYLFGADSRLERKYNTFGQSCQAISKMNDPSNPMRIFNSAMLRRINKFCEQIAREHRLYEPNRSPLRHPSETQSR